MLQAAGIPLRTGFGTGPGRILPACNRLMPLTTNYLTGKSMEVTITLRPRIDKLGEFAMFSL